MALYTVASKFSYMSTMPLRPLCEDLIYGCWLKTIPEDDANQLVQLGMMADIFKGIDVQRGFMPKAYEMFGWLPDDVIDEVDGSVDYPGRDIPEGVNEQLRTQNSSDLKQLGIKLGWPKGRQPKIRDMAISCDLLDVYDFFYHGTSKSVHSSLHTMARMVWTNKSDNYSISSQHFEKYYVNFALAYGVWLVEETLSRITSVEFPDEYQAIDDQAHSVWLAFILGGLARRRRFPPLVTYEELRNSSSQ
jgi:hypothetical protein